MIFEADSEFLAYIETKMIFLIQEKSFRANFPKKVFSKNIFNTKIKKIPRRVSFAVFFDEDTAEAAIGAK